MTNRIQDLQKYFGNNEKNTKLDNLLKPPKKESQKYMPKFQVPDENLVDQADLLFLKSDEDYKYSLTVVDASTGKSDAEPLKTKDSKEVVKAMKAIFKRKIVKPPKVIETDAGNEFKGEFTKQMNKLGINVIQKDPGRSRSLGIVEGKNRQYSKLLNRRMRAQELTNEEESTNWTDALPLAVEYLNLTTTHEPYTPPKKMEFRINPNEPILQEGTKVRVILNKPKDYLTDKRLNGKFREGDIRWNKEIKTIISQIYNKDQPVMYQISGETALYTYPQLQVIDNEKNEYDKNIQSHFEVEKIMSHKKHQGNYIYRIKWKDYPSKYNSWEPEQSFGIENPILITYKKKHNI